MLIFLLYRREIRRTEKLRKKKKTRIAAIQSVNPKRIIVQRDARYSALTDRAGTDVRRSTRCELRFINRRRREELSIKYTRRSALFTSK